MKSKTNDCETNDPAQSRSGQFLSQQTKNITIRLVQLSSFLSVGVDVGANKRTVWMICRASTTLKQIISMMLIF